MPPSTRTRSTAVAATLTIAVASLAACGGGADNPISNAVNTPTCSTASGNSGVLPTAVLLGIFATVYQLEAGTIDEFGAFIQTSSLIFALAADGSATVDGNSAPVSSSCYLLSGNKLSLTLGDAGSATKGNLELLSGGRASGTINGKAVRTRAQ
jgi:hypothetical protein